MDITVELGGRGDRTTRVYATLREAIVDGRLRVGERLPPSRDLARRLGVSRGTITVAYELLAAEGFVAGRVGSGTVVTCDRAESGAAQGRGDGPTGRESRARDDAPVGPRPTVIWRDLAARPVLGTAVDRMPMDLDFRVGTPDPDLFPLGAWRRAVAHALQPDAFRAAGHADAAGIEPLRAAIARHVGVARAVRATPEQVVVTSGAQQALDLIGRVRIEPGTCVAVEEPGYPAAQALWASMGARVVPVPVDVDGIRVDALPGDARLILVTPSHQFPTGVTLSFPRRAALLAWAGRRDAIIVEDDYDSEFRFSPRPLEPVHALDRSGSVVYVGSFSKTLSPRLRLGFLVAPPSLVPALVTARRLSDWHGELVTQLAMTELIDRGLLVWHLRRARKAYARRHEVLVRAIAEHLGVWLELVPSSAGLHVCARMREDGVRAHADVDDVLARAAELGVAAESLGRYCAGPPQAGLVLGYGAIREERIEEGVRRLATAFREVADGRDRARGEAPPSG